MPDYSLGRAHGKIEIDYDGSGADRAARGIDRTTKSAEGLDKSLTKTQKTLGATDRQLQSSGTSAQGYASRLRDVRQATDDVEAAERRYKTTLLDTSSTIEDIERDLERLGDARERHTKSVDRERDAHNALRDSMSVGSRALDSFKSIIPNLTRHFDQLAEAQDGVTDKAGGLAQALGTAAKAVAFLGPQGRAAAGGLLAISEGIEKIDGLGNVIPDFVKGIAGLEVAVGKISGITLGGTALGGLTGLAGGAGLQGIVNLAGAAQQLSGALGLLPAALSGAGVVAATLGVAFQGVGDALTDMMADDPKKFLEDIANMGPAAAQSMLAIAQFRDQFKLGAGAVQDSFFSKIAADIVPLIQTWLPALVSAGSQIAGVLGDAAHQLAQLLQQPAMMQAFQTFISNVAAGLQALQPAMAPMLEIFTQLTVVGSSFFQQLGGQITHMLDFFAQVIDKAAASGQLQAWIQAGINGFGNLVNIAYSLGSAFLNIMDIAERFGGGGLLAWLEQISVQLNTWTQSAEGQAALTDFFALLRQATDAFLPILPPLLNGLVSIGKAFVELGVATAPGWLDFFNMFAQAMASLGPQIASLGPSLNQFLHNMGVALVNLVNQVGPQLPALFNTMSNAFSTLLPQIGPLVDAFLDLALNVGPQLPKFFAAVTALIVALLPYVPVLVDLVRNLVSALTWFLEAGAGVIDWFTRFLKALGDALANLPETLGRIWDTISNFFEELPDKAVEWGKNILGGLIEGLLDTGVLGALGGAAKKIIETVADWFPSSPAKVGPFSGSGYTMVRGQKMVADLAAGMLSETGAVTAAASQTAAAASGALNAGLSGARAPLPGGAGTEGGALLPDHIAGADTSILSAYKNHEFSDNRGLKGLAKDLGEMLDAAQSGFNLLSQQVMQPIFTALGMVPGLNAQQWTKMSPEQFAAQQQQEAERKAAADAKKAPDPTWQDVFGPSVSPGDAKKKTAAASVPLVQNPDGTWTSPDPAWAHLIARESGGINQRQKIIDVNSGGNEAEGLFQITPKTWAAHGGTDFAANPLAATPQQQGVIAARILQGNPSGSDWGAGLPGRENAQDLLSGISEPTWAQVTGSSATAPAAAPGTYGLPAGTNTGGYGTGNADTFPPWVMALAEQFGIKPSTYGGHQESDRGEPGYAPNPQGLNRGIDWTGPTENLQRFAEYLETIPASLEQVIWQNPTTGRKTGIGGGRIDPGYYPQGTYDVHGGNDPSNIHVHTRQSAAVPLPGAPSTPLQAGIGSAAGSSGLILPSGKTAEELLDTTKQNVSVNDQLLQSYLQGNPALAAQIDAARTPGAADETVLGGLNAITSTIDTLKQQDAAGNQNTIQALQSTQNQIAKDAGFQQAPSALSTAQSVASGVGGAVSSVFQAMQSGLDALAATQDIADRLVYGVRNTEDINILIDDFQKYITYAADILSAAGSITSMVGGFTGGIDFGGTSAAGSMLSLIASALEGVNMAIDFGQQIYHIAGGYVGRFLSFLTAGGGTPLMGDVRFLLNKNTGQLLSYSQDNPLAKNSLNVPSWMNSMYDYRGGGNPNPQVNQQLNVYAGPGQSAADMMTETMWLVNTGGGGQGAMQAANF